MIEKKTETFEAELKLDAEKALEDTKELADLMGEMTPQVVIRGARECTFNIYPSSTRIYEEKQVDAITVDYIKEKSRNATGAESAYLRKLITDWEKID